MIKALWGAGEEGEEKGLHSWLRLLEGGQLCLPSEGKAARTLDPGALGPSGRWVVGAKSGPSALKPRPQEQTRTQQGLLGEGQECLAGGSVCLDYSAQPTGSLAGSQLAGSLKFPPGPGLRSLLEPGKGKE